MYGSPLRKPNGNPYRSVSIDTASPRTRLLMLFDGAIRFCNSAVASLEKHDVAGKGAQLVRAQAIVNELQAILDHDVAPELCASLSSLYAYIAERLIRANVGNDTALIAESVDLLRTIRSGFAEAEIGDAETKAAPESSVESGAALP